MTNMDLLTEAMDRSNLTVVKICEMADIERQTFYNRLNGKGEFTASEIAGLTKALHLTKRQRDDIFFAK